MKIEIGLLLYSYQFPFPDLRVRSTLRLRICRGPRGRNDKRAVRACDQRFKHQSPEKPGRIKASLNLRMGNIQVSGVIATVLTVRLLCGSHAETEQTHVKRTDYGTGYGYAAPRRVARQCSAVN